ncbi:conserved hypothetical protein [Gammaproteobacteria bacterium]
MRYLMLPVLLLALAFGLWPYYHLYRLDRALVQNDLTTLMVLVDLDAVRAERKQHLERQGGEVRNPVTQTLHQMANILTGNNVENTITLDWVRETLRGIPARPDEEYPSLLHYTSFAFFEGFRHFLIRIRDLGENPVHVRWTLHDWMWQITAIYDY